MKPYIMNYSEKIQITQSIQNDISSMSTVKTFSIENDDSDSIHSLFGTFQTNIIESSDNDHLSMGTLITKTPEAQDNDYTYYDGTMMTESIEGTDDDYIFS